MWALVTLIDWVKLPCVDAASVYTASILSWEPFLTFWQTHCVIKLLIGANLIGERLYHSVGLIGIYLIMRKVKQGLIGLRLSCVYFHHCELCVQIFRPCLCCVCGLFMIALQETWKYEINTKLALHLWYWLWFLPSLLSVLWFCIFLLRILFQKVKFINISFLFS